MKKLSSFLRQHLAFIIAIATLSFFVIGTLNYSRFRGDQLEKDARSNLQMKLSGKKSDVEKALYSRIFNTRGIAAIVAHNPQITSEEFSRLANEFIKNDNVISSMAISKDCVLSAIFPYKGHEAAIGLDLLEHPERRQIVEQTIKTKETFVAGPVELVEGGIAFISYTPVFDKTTTDTNTFWGVADIVILKDKLFTEAGLEIEEDGYLFALKGYNGLGNDGAIFWGNESVFKNDPVYITIDLPTGSWILASVPVKGWGSYFDYDKNLYYILLFGSIVISILIWLFSKAMIKIKRKEVELRAIFNSMDTLVIEIDKEARYVKIAPTNDKLLYKPADQLLGKTLYDVFDKDTAEFHHNAIKKCLEELRVVTIDYSMEINGKTHWFSARISNKSANSVIFNTHDITALKKQEERLIKSSNELAELNALKDKFFSIIAHDLRNPISSYQSITELLLTDYYEFDDKEKIEILKSMQETIIQVSDLLENLLNWANSQSGTIQVYKTSNNLFQIIDELITSLTSSAQIKQIQFKNEIPKELEVYLDINIAKIILRNLVSNSIKFTDSNGLIVISCEENEEFVRIKVTDNGIGIPKEKIPKLFSVDQSSSTKGTNGEIGTGLGLIFCKDFIEKHGGSIQVDSIVNEGTSISFTIPNKK